MIKKGPFQYAANPRNRNVANPLTIFATAGMVDYDDFKFSDLTTLFQDTNGATPVTTVGQSIARIYGQRYKGTLSAEMVTNGSFSSGASWTAGTGWTIAAGVASHTGTGTAQLTQPLTFVLGGSYIVTFTISGYTSGTVTARLQTGGTTTGTARSGNGTYTEILDAGTGPPTLIGFITTGSTILSIDNVSVKQVLGYNPVQATGSKQPTWQQTGTLGYATFDAVDDILQTAIGPVLPALPHYVCLAFSRPASLTGNTFGGSGLSAGAGHQIQNGGFGVSRIIGRFNSTATPSGGVGANVSIGAINSSPSGIIEICDSYIVSGTTDGVMNSSDRNTVANTWVAGDVGTAALSLALMQGIGNGANIYRMCIAWGASLTLAQRLQIRRAFAASCGLDI